MLTWNAASTVKHNAVWTYVGASKGYATGVAVRGSASTSGSFVDRFYSSSQSTATTNVEVSSVSGQWIYHLGGDCWDWQGNWGVSAGWSAIWSGNYTYFTLASNAWTETIPAHWSGTAWLWYYWPASKTTYGSWFTRSSRTAPAFTARSYGSSSSVTTCSYADSASTITLTVQNRGSTYKTLTRTKTPTYTYTLNGWNTSAPSSIVDTTPTYAAGSDQSSPNDLNLYATFTKGTTPTYSYNPSSTNATVANIPNPSNYTDTSSSYTVTLSNADSLGSNNTLSSTITKTYTFSNWVYGSTDITLPYNYTTTRTITSKFNLSSSVAAAVTLPTPTKASYRFMGWSKTSGGSVSYAGGESYTPSSDVTLYAIWQLDQFTVTVNNNLSWTGNYAPTGGGTYTVGDSVTLSQTLKTGYHFVKWTNSSNVSVGTNSSYTFTMPGNNVTYTSNVAANTYTVVFNANDGTGTMSNQSYTYDTYQALTTNKFTKLGYKFLGWSKSATATSATYTDKQSVKNLTSTNNGTVTLYAIWEPHTEMYIYTNGAWTPALKYVYTVS